MVLGICIKMETKMNYYTHTHTHTHTHAHICGREGGREGDGDVGGWCLVYASKWKLK